MVVDTRQMVHLVLLDHLVYLEKMVNLEHLATMVLQAYQLHRNQNLNGASIVTLVHQARLEILAHPALLETQELPDPLVLVVVEDRLVHLDLQVLLEILVHLVILGKMDPLVNL